MRVVHYVGHYRWAAADGPDEILGVAELLYLLSEYALDPRFEWDDLDRRGDFIQPFRSGPSWFRGPHFDDHPNGVRFEGNFATYSCSFGIDTDEPALIAVLTEAIRNNQRTADYQELARAEAAMREAEAVRRGRIDHEREIRLLVERNEWELDRAIGQQAGLRPGQGWINR
jgi:hypothetical protein